MKTTELKNVFAAAAVAMMCACGNGATETDTANNKTQTETSSSYKMEQTLNEPQKSLVTIACLEAKGDIDNLKKAIDHALDEGLTVSQVKESLSQLYAYTGFPRSLNGLGTLQSVTEQRKAEGKHTDEGRDADPLPQGYDALKQGTQVQTQLTGQPFDYTFAPATDYYLKAHLFGDIFARNNLTHAQREVVTVGALCGLKGVEPQLVAHIKGAKNMGVTDEEIHSIPATIAQTVGQEEAWRAQAAIDKVYGTGKAGGAPVDNQIFPTGSLNVNYAQYFTGNSYLHPYDVKAAATANVTFEPGCRNNWHIHHNATQILICVGGYGWYQEWEKPARLLRPGDIVEIKPETKHWHGATADSWFQHLSVTVAGNGGCESNEWLEPVSDEAYGKLAQ